MPGGELWEPPAARAALARAAQLRGRYSMAVQAIQRDRRLTTDEKRQRLQLLHGEHQRAMAELRQTRHRAHREASRQFVRDLAADDAAPSALRLDIYQQSLERALAMDVPALVQAYDLAELIQNSLAMRAYAVAAMTKRGPLPNDPASGLVDRFAGHQLPDGHGGTRHAFPKASVAWDRLQALESWERADHIQVDAAFSVAATPPRAEDPSPPDPAQVARADVAALYGDGRPGPAEPVGGNGGGAPLAG